MPSKSNKLTRHIFREMGTQTPAHVGASFSEKWDTSISYSSNVVYGPNKPDYKRAIAQGYSATTSALGERRYIRSKPLSAVFGYRASIGGPIVETFSTFSTTTGRITRPGFPSSVANSVAENRARVALAGCYKDLTTTWRGGNTLAEVGETIRMLANPVKSLYQHTYSLVGRVGKLKKVYQRDPVRYGKALGGAWLAYTFGIDPLLKDINDANKAVKYMAEHLGANSSVRIIGTGKFEEESHRITNDVVVYPKYCMATAWGTRNSLVRYTGAVRLQDPGTSQLLNNFGVGVSDIVPAIWEAIPWSFMVDYFLNVSEVLDSFHSLSADVMWLQRTVRNRAVHRGAPVQFNPIHRSTIEPGFVFGGQWIVSSTSFTRDAVSEFLPRPELQFRVPGSLRKFGNIAALVASIAASKPRT